MTKIDKLGPGRLILVVGPSGAGKDAVLAGVKAACAESENILFPRRVVTRGANDHEDHDSIAPSEFDRRREDGAFALSWEAHGLKYAIPRSIEDGIRAGLSVVCNVSRGVVSDARERYANIVCVQITAPEDMLADRLSRRGRTTDGSIEERMRRTSLYSALRADFEIANSGTLSDAVATLVALLRSTGATQPAPTLTVGPV